MSKYLDKLIAAAKREPVRLRVYSVVALVVAYLVARGVLQPADSELILGLAAAVLVVERTRAHTVPAAKGTRKR